MQSTIHPQRKNFKLFKPQSIMATKALSLIDNNNNTIIKHENPDAESTDKSPFRRIEFHLARKPFTGFSNGSCDGSFRLETLNPTTSSSKSTQQSVGSGCVNGDGSSGKKTVALEMENGLDPELSFGITFKRIGAGLENLGNTCFLNSVLQCLTYTEPLAAYLQSGKHQSSCRKAGFCALCAIQKHVSRALQLSGRSLAPKDLVSNLRCISRTFRNSRQEDAHEYMVNLLESMHKCCLPNGVPSESQSAYDRSLVHKIFGGQLRSQCNYCSDKFDPFLDLSLEILRADNLYKAFANFTAKEQLDGGAKQYQCQQCKHKVKALKQLTIYKAPNVLTIHLKRFGSHMSGQKIDKKIHFSSTLDLKPFVTGPYEGDLRYTLYGVLVHAGWSTHSGHYYCFVRTSSGMWYSLDDNRVIQVSEKKVFEQKAYMLFYFKDRQNFPLKKTTDAAHQKEKVAVNGTVKVSIASKQSQMKIGLSNGFSPVAPKEAKTNTILSNGSLNGHKGSAPAKTMSNGFSADAPKEAQVKTLVTACTERSGLTPVAPKETQMKTSENDRSLNGYQSPVNVDTVRNGFSTGAQEQTQKTEASAPKIAAKSNLENSQKGETGDNSVQAALTVSCSNPITTPVDTVNKTLDEVNDKEIAVGDGQIKEVSTKLPDLSGLQEMETSVEKKSRCKKSHKRAKNLLKCSVISMKFSSNILMGTSLNKRKKKKRKQSKRIKSLEQENSFNEGPSSSDKSEAQVAVKPLFANASKENSINESPSSSDKVNAQKAVDPFESGTKHRDNKDCAVLATSECNGVSNGSQSSTQKDLVHMLTRGMDDRYVPRWDDDDDSTPYQRRETKRELTIGYIGDEWDEEYDRGKRKKVRMSQTEFDGKNPFQNIANERLKSHAEKQTLINRSPLITVKNKQFKKSRSGNGPFRI
ncbi:ubiquitin carboxyl-terminal hydrolase 23-like isoform X2 [Rutidosis leptorrhynchoides]|uniref:ubiquitin carboxyl-terminal hydrolase 23-like isoform X2 n=1 Tax=Rutidosis leptorrhynchoides TaxID=125765 RepID=UPI003A9986E6